LPSSSGEELIPAVGSFPWTPEEDERLRELALTGHECRRDGKADAP